jgi:hypothetical protein
MAHSRRLTATATNVWGLYRGSIGGSIASIFNEPPGPEKVRTWVFSVLDDERWLADAIQPTHPPVLPYIDHFLAKKHEPRPEPNGRTLGGNLLEKKTVSHTFFKKVGITFS